MVLSLAEVHASARLPEHAHCRPRMVPRCAFLRSQLESIREDNLADDMEIDFERMSLWSERAASEYFESAGSLDPTPVPNLRAGAAIDLTSSEPIHAWSAVVPRKWYTRRCDRTRRAATMQGRQLAC
jgi:hypothetical protein